MRKAQAAFRDHNDSSYNYSKIYTWPTGIGEKIFPLLSIAKHTDVAYRDDWFDRSGLLDPLLKYHFYQL